MRNNAGNYGYGICRHCRNTFKKRSHSNQYCTNDCKEQYILLQRENTIKSKYLIFERDDFKCVYCGKSPIEDSVTLVIDHIEPYSINRNNNIYNLITSCVKCNIGKGPLPLRKEIYDRIIKRNKIRTDMKISKDSQQFVNEILIKYFNNPTKNKPCGLMQSQS
jgi:5-methylcytosine-specific restriction endonuclease McrA